MPIENFNLMKRIFLSLLLIVASSILFAQTPNNQMEIRNTLHLYLQQYPQAQLRDVYKTCFQDIFGPGHILSDTIAATKYLRSELVETKVYGGPLFEPTGCQGNYYRVNILLVANGTIPLEKFMNAFIRSANGTTQISIEDWAKLWSDVESILKSFMQWNKQNQFDSEFIKDMFQQNQYMCHHSPLFNATYNFHYRIIRKDIFINEILPLIK